MRYVRMGLIAGLVAGGLMLSLAVAAEDKPMTGNTIEVKVGQEIARTWDQVKADKFAYGPKQVINGTKTIIYLPYGNAKGVYNELQGVTLIDPSTTETALMMPQSGDRNVTMGFKFHFDKPISSFIYHAGWSELGLAANTAAGVEYSVDGKAWKTVVEVKGADKPGSSIVEPLVKDVKVENLNTSDLYIRHYSRDPADPTADGPGRWFKLRTSGSPGWGDAATTFFTCQLQLVVTAAAPGAAPPAAPKAEEKK